MFATKVLKILIPRVRKGFFIPSVLRVLNHEQILNFIKCLSFIYWDKCIFSLLFCYCCSRSCCGPYQMNISTLVYSSTFLIASTCSPFPEDCDKRCRGCSACAQSRLQGPGNEPHYLLSPLGAATLNWLLAGLIFIPASPLDEGNAEVRLIPLASFPCRIDLWFPQW